jgi:hypothetical protein
MMRSKTCGIRVRLSGGLVRQPVFAPPIERRLNATGAGTLTPGRTARSNCQYLWIGHYHAALHATMGAAEMSGQLVRLTAESAAALRTEQLSIPVDRTFSGGGFDRCLDRLLIF